jgi:flagellar motor switch/type III secretory pathway protein FliN
MLEAPAELRRAENWAQGEEGQMNIATPIVESKSAKVAQVAEKNSEIDPSEFLPWLPCTLALDIPVVRFSVRDLLSLANGSIVETAYHQSSDLPLRVNGQLVGWTEFEVVGERLAVRLTDLS